MDYTRSRSYVVVGIEVELLLTLRSGDDKAFGNLF
jgi:hypothetical protein